MHQIGINSGFGKHIRSFGGVASTPALGNRVHDLAEIIG